jgi:methyl-accepting chemotaxis protein
MNNIASAIDKVAQDISVIEDSSNKTMKVAKAGSQKVDQSVDAMEHIHSSVQNITTQMKELGKSSEQIGEIVNVITDIASQTNLLALNAAIEAARAGEAGKGFAVVADEVRKLAERSSEATTEVTNLIQNIQDVSKVSIKTTEEGRKYVEDGVKLATEAKSSLGEILEATQGNSMQIQNIAASSEEVNVSTSDTVQTNTALKQQIDQTSTDIQQVSDYSGKVNDAMNNVVDVSRNNAANTEEVSASVEEVTASMVEVESMFKDLNVKSKDLNEKLNYFIV